jgi:hypothetical protein
MPTKEKGPPWWFRFIAPFLGVKMDTIKQVWAWLNGRKLFIVALVTAAPVIAQAVHDVVCSFNYGTCPAGAEKILLVAATVVAVGHKLFKLLGWAEQPK